MPTVIPNLYLMFGIYLISSVMIVSISTRETAINKDQTEMMLAQKEQLLPSNYTLLTSTSSGSSSIRLIESVKLIDKLSDEKGSFIMANTICCAILVIYRIIQYLVLGTLRVSEQQHSKEAFWDYFINKSLFLIFYSVANSNHERFTCAVWFTTLGSILLLSKLCKDRFEYLSSSPSAKKWNLIKISLLMSVLLIITLFCNTIVFTSHSSTYSLLVLADASYVLTFVISIIIRFIILTYDMRTVSKWEKSSSIVYYGDLFFETVMLTIDLLRHSHLLILSAWLWPIKLWPLSKIHTLIMEMRRKYRKHRNYLLVVNLMENHFSMATDDELCNSDDCAICWDPMESARKLPCGHLFHNSCLRSWLEQDTSCPTCRTSLKAPQDDVEDQSETEEEFVQIIQSANQRNHLFHFDTSRYTNNQFLSWLPTISIEGFM